MSIIDKIFFKLFMSNLMTFILGITSSIIATIVIYIFRFYLGFIINLIFYKLYPNVSGEYKLYRYRTIISKDEVKQDKDNKCLIEKSGDNLINQKLLKWLENKKKKFYFTIKLRQFANKISGKVYYIHENTLKYVEKIHGKITPSMILILNYESIDKKHHDFGTYLLNLTNDFSIMKGIKSGLCVNCNDVTSLDILLLKK